MGPGAPGPQAPVAVANVEGQDQQQAEHAHGAGDHRREGHGPQRGSLLRDDFWTGRRRDTEQVRKVRRDKGCDLVSVEGYVWLGDLHVRDQRRPLTVGRVHFEHTDGWQAGLKPRAKWCGGTLHLLG